MLLAFVGFQYRTALLVWAVLTVVCLATAVGLCAKGLGLRGTLLAGFSAFVLVYQPLYANVRTGQTYVLLLVLLVVAWWAYRRRADATAGVALGCLAAFKLAAAPLWVLLLAQRRWKALGWAATIVLAVGLSSVVLLGLQAWHTYVRVVPKWTTSSGMLVTAFQSLPGFVRHLTVVDPQLNPEPLVPAPALGTWIPGAGLAVMTGMSLFVTRGSPPSDLSFAVFVTAGTIVNPQSLDYHYVLLLLPIAILLTWARNQPRPGAPIMIGVAMFLIAADLQYRSPEMGRGALALLSYPKLYGAMILWATAVYACRERRQAAEHAGRPTD